MPETFDFCLHSRVAEKLPPEQPEATSFNKWEFVARPNVPYRAKFKVTLQGLRWYLNEAGNGLDLFCDLEHNAGRLERYWERHQRHTPFNFMHEYMGLILVRFATAVAVPKALPNSNGLLDPLEVTLIHHNPGWSS